MNAKSILSSDAFWIVNKRLTKYLNDISSTVLLSYLIDKEDYHDTRNELVLIDGEKWFFATSERIEDATTLSYKQQKRCLKILSANGFIDQKLIGVPAKLHFTIRHNQICLLLTSSIDKREKLDLTKGNDIIRTEYKEQNTKTTHIGNSNEDLFVAVDYVESESTIISQSKTEEIILRLGEGQSEKISPEERMIQNVLVRAIEFFKAYPDQIKIMTANARIRESHDHAFFLQELEKFIRYNADNLSVMKNIEKHIPRKFGSWLQNYNSFNRKSSNNYGKTGRKNKHLISEQDARDVLADLIENGI